MDGIIKVSVQLKIKQMTPEENDFHTACRAKIDRQYALSIIYKPEELEIYVDSFEVGTDMAVSYEE